MIHLEIRFGNSLEVKEAIEVLKGNGPKDLQEVSLTLATYMVSLSLNIPKEKAKKLVIEVIENGKAFEKFKELVRWQGGNEEWIDNPDEFPKSLYNESVRAFKSRIYNRNEY